MIDGAVVAVAERALGAPVRIEELKIKPGRRATVRAIGSVRTGIVKVYASERAPVVAARVAAVVAGYPAEAPDDPLCLPEVLALDADRHTVVLSDVPGAPFSSALLAGDIATCRRVGRAIGQWHVASEGSDRQGLTPHTAAREGEILARWIDRSSPGVARAVRPLLALAREPWVARTVVHRDLYEEQIMVGERIGLIDLDDSALGPPELDLGNLLAHLVLLERRCGHDLAGVRGGFICGYRDVGPALDPALLTRCLRLSLARLACIHDAPELVEDVVQ